MMGWELVDILTGINLVQAVVTVRDRAFFWVLGMIQGLGGSRQREGLVLLGLVEKCGCIFTFTRDPPVLGCGSH